MTPSIAYQIVMESNPITYPKGHGSEKFERPVFKQKQDISGNGYDKVDKFAIQDSGKKLVPHSHGNNWEFNKEIVLRGDRKP